MPNKVSIWKKDFITIIKPITINSKFYLNCKLEKNINNAKLYLENESLNEFFNLRRIGKSWLVSIRPLKTKTILTFINS